MGLRALFCSEDPVESLLRKTIKAEILRVPDARVQPLSVLQRGSEYLRFCGTLGGLLQGRTPFDLAAEVPTPAATISGKRTQSIKLALGIDLLKTFVQGFGVAIDVAKVEVSLSTHRTIAFSFEDVERVFIDHGKLNRALRRRKLQTDDPLTTAFFQSGPWGAPRELLLVDAVLRSRCFKIHFDAVGDSKLKLPDLGGLLTGPSLTADWSAERELTFRATSAAPQVPTFAYTALRVYLKKDGAMTLVPDHHDGGERLESLQHLETCTPAAEPQRLSDQPSLVFFDEEP